MIEKKEPLSMAEALEYIKKSENSEKGAAEFIKKFTKLNSKEAVELKKKIESLGLIKLKPEYIAKIIDLIPESIGDLNKVFMGVSLDEDESKKIFEAIKQFR